MTTLKLLHKVCCVFSLDKQPHYYLWKDKIATIFIIHDLLYRINELENLIHWAKRKRLSGVRTHYARLLMDSSNKLMRYSVHNSFTVEMLQWVLVFEKQLFSKKYYPTGSATKYRTNS